MLSLLFRAAAAGLVAVTVAVLFARAWWGFDLLTHFRPQWAVVALALGIAAAASRRPGPAAVLVLVAAFHFWAIRGLWSGGPATPAAPVAAGQPLRAVSANVRRANPAPERALAFLRGARADLIVLVEATTERWRAPLAELRADYPFRAPAGLADSAPVVVFSRHPIVSSQIIEPPAGDAPYLLLDIAVAGRHVAVAAIHPESPSPADGRDTAWRNRQLSHVADEVADEQWPLLVAGDFNTSPWSPTFRDLLEVTGLEPAARGLGWMPTWPACCWPLRTPIDHLLVRGPLAVRGFAVGPDIGSDHLPLIVDLWVLDG